MWLISSRVDCIVKAQNVLGECTLWCEREQTLWWVDSRAPALYRHDLSLSETRALALPEVIGSFAFRVWGGMVAALRSGLYFLDPVGGALQRIAAPEAGLPENRFNDGRCDRRGRFFAGTMSDVRRDPSGSLYRLDTDLACTRVFSGIIVPNSIAWSPDDRRMYFADTYRGRIMAYDYDAHSGALSNERLFVDASSHPGKPDGSCVDAEGCLWNAEYGGARVVRYTPDGRIDRVVPVPVSNPTCCCFGGAKLDTLFVSTARQRLSEEQLVKEPLAGSVLAFRPGASGLPEGRFGA